MSRTKAIASTYVKVNKEPYACKDIRRVLIGLMDFGYTFYGKNAAMIYTIAIATTSLSVILQLASCMRIDHEFLDAPVHVHVHVVTMHKLNTIITVLVAGIRQIVFLSI